MDIAAGGTLQLRYLYRHKKHKMHQVGARVTTNIFSQNILTHTTFHKIVIRSHSSEIQKLIFAEI